MGILQENKREKCWMNKENKYNGEIAVSLLYRVARKY